MSEERPICNFCNATTTDFEPLCCKAAKVHFIWDCRMSNLWMQFPNWLAQKINSELEAGNIAGWRDGEWESYLNREEQEE